MIECNWKRVIRKATDHSEASSNEIRLVREK